MHIRRPRIDCCLVVARTPGPISACRGFGDGEDGNLCLNLRVGGSGEVEGGIDPAAGPEASTAAEILKSRVCTVFEVALEGERGSGDGDAKGAGIYTD